MDEVDQDGLLTSNVVRENQNDTFTTKHRQQDHIHIVQPYSSSDIAAAECTEEHDTLKNGDGNGFIVGPVFSPHPPESPKDAELSPGAGKGLKKAKRFARRKGKVLPTPRKHSADSSSDDDSQLVGLRVNHIGRKLPPIGKNGHDDELHQHEGQESLNHKPVVRNLKPLTHLKDQKRLIEEFKLNQSAEKENLSHEDVRTVPVKALQKHDGVVSGHLKRISDKLNNNQLDINDQSEDTLTSVSSGSNISDTDSESEQKDTNHPKYQPEPPSSTPPVKSRQHHSLSLTSLRNNLESAGRYSDSEAFYNRRNVKDGKNAKDLWKKAKLVSYLPKVPASKARDRNSNFVKEELEKYLPERKLMVFIGTWNMHGEKQLPVFVDDFLLPQCCQFMQDLYVIGSQESTPLRREWEIKLQEALGPSHVMIYSSAFGVLHVAMFLRRELVWFCSAVEQATVATRPGHMIKTKGAIALSLSIFGTSFLFINSHLTAHEPKWKERVADYRLIRKTLSLPLNYSESPSRTTDVTSRFEQVFWFGDFNFRVSERREVVEKFLSQCEEDEDPSYDELIEKDQMTRLMNKDDGVFEHFKECPINFPPTYRFNINVDNPGEYSSVRVPSWTDRIVYRSRENDIKPHHYDHCTALINSDHRPVYGIFETSIKPIKDRIAFTGVHFVRDVYIEANRRRAAPPRNQNRTTVCTIL